MHVVVWTVSGERFAVETGAVVEVVPAVEARPAPRSPGWVRGLMDYRGALIPLLDVRSLLGHDETTLRRACRVVVVASEDGPIGLLVESVESVEPTAPEPAHEGLDVEDAPYLGPIVRSGDRTVQVVRPDRLLREEHRAVLFGRTAGAAE